MKSNYRLGNLLVNGITYIVLTFFALVMIFPFLVMLFTSLKEPGDTYRFPPKLLPREPISATVEGFSDPLPLYSLTVNGVKSEWALARSNIKIGRFVDPQAPAQVYEVPLTDVEPTGGYMKPQKTTYEGKEAPLYDVQVDGQIVAMVKVSETALGKFVNPKNPAEETLQNVRLSEPVEKITWHPENYLDLLTLQRLDRSLTNTTLVTLLVVLGQLVTSVLGGYAFARLRFPGRDQLFVLYLGTIMIPFVVLIIPLYQLMVLIGWVDRQASLVIPWIFTAYGTFLMRQFFVTVPRDIEEAALIDGASRLKILWKIFIPAAAPALATLATFTFLYAWNSFFWPLVIINTGNYDNHVLTLSLNTLRGRAADSPNLVLAGAAISVLPPTILFILGQRFFIESAMSSGVKG